MKTRLFRAAACALLATTCLTSRAAAQLAAPAPVRQNIDGNGVDLFLGTVSLDAPALTLGQGEQGLSYYRLTRGSGWSDNMTATLNLVGSTITVSLGGLSDSFTVSGSAYTPTEGNGATLAFNSSTNIYTYRGADGTTVLFDRNRNTGAPAYANEGRVTEIKRPDGSRLVFSYESVNYCANVQPSGVCAQMSKLFRISSVRNSYGYRLNFAYDAYEYAYDPASPQNQPDFAAYSRITGVSGENLAAPAGTGGQSQSFTETSTGLVVTDAMNRSMSFRMSGGVLGGITLPGSSIEDITFNRAGGTTGRVTSVETRAGTTTYAASDANGVRTVTVTDALTHATVYRFDIASRRLTSMTNPNGNVSAWQYDSTGRVTRITRPGGAYTEFTYDSRGNVTEARQVAQQGTNVPDIVTTASFPTTCTNPVTCNQPISTPDARGQTTEYTYDPTHGGVLTITGPAPGPNGDRPQVRKSYVELQAFFRNSAGPIVASGDPVTLPSGTSTCSAGTVSSCVGTAHELAASVTYGPQAPGTGNNLLPVSTKLRAGDDSIITETAMAYDTVGNMTSIDGPIAGNGDTARFRYNAARERIGTVGPDPDGTGPLPHRAQRVIISAVTGLLSTVETGTVLTQSDSDWHAMTVHEAVEAEYDAARRPVVTRLSAGGAIHALTQTDYDAVGRTRCVAVRMNPALFGSTPTSACEAGAVGSFGPDRITRKTYDAGGRVIQVDSAVDTPLEAPEVRTEYAANGQVAAVRDALNNRTTYEYDGHDRLRRTRYPMVTAGANESSTTDYEELTYETRAGGTLGTNLVTSRRLRDGQSIALSYDALGRVTRRDLPNTATWEYDVDYAYDLLGRMTSATDTNGHDVTFTYDALGHVLSEGSAAYGAKTYRYDAAGRRTRMTWSDGFFVVYDYNDAGEMTRIRERNGSTDDPVTSGAGVLATFGYDGRGRRVSLTRGNGATTTYAYDNASRLSELVQNPLGTTDDLTLGFAYNPASQIVRNTRSNDSFASLTQTPGRVTSTVDGRNQLTETGGSAVAHDNRGNVSSIGSVGYAYTSENRLVGAPSPMFAYDGLGRLYYRHEPSIWLDYDGGRLTAEIDAGTNTIQRRWVHGPGVDEPLVQYEGSGTTNRRWLHADERGSIVAQSDATGAVTAVNRYDEYGVPASGNAGRFQYTGQVWLVEAGLYYYRARMYNPREGRFMQTDPIGFWGGMNQCTYAGNDPVNARDPSGLDSDTITVTGKRPRREPPEPPSIPTEPAGSISNGTGGPDVPVEAPETETCEIGPISITKRGDTVTISGSVEVTYLDSATNRGRGLIGALSEGDSQRVLDAINSHWSGTFGRYSVTTRMTSGSGGLAAHVGAIQEAGRGGPMRIPAPHPPGGDPTYEVAWARTVAHEFGHVMGLSPTYDHNDGGIMARGYPPAPRMEEHIRRILEECGLEG